MEYEKEIYNSLAKLYSSTLKSAPENRKVRYGGEEHILKSFHYRSTSTVSDGLHKKGSKKFEYIDANEDAPIIYRWEVKGALATQMKKKDGKLQHRVFTPFTVYKSTHVADQYLCLAAMTVRCSTRRFDFLMKKLGSTQTPEMWQGLDKMKHFYACPEVLVDHALVKKDRYRYWDCEQHIYKEERLVLLDTRFPSNRNLPPEKLEIVQDRYNQWILYPGRLQAHEDSMLEAQTLLISRSARQQEEKAMKESLKRARDLELLISAQQNQQNRSHSDKRAKQSKPLRRTSNGGGPKNRKETPEYLSKVYESTSSESNDHSVMQTQINQLLVELSELRKQNSIAARVTNSNSSSSLSSVSPQSKRLSDLEKASKEEDLTLALLAKRRQLAEEEQEMAEFKAVKKRLKLESIAYANQLLREGELERVKMKIQADQLQTESSLRQQNIAEEDRRRRNDFDDSKRRQQLQFASEEHALMLEKERARMKITDSTVQHNQMMQMVALSQRSNDLALVIKNTKFKQNVASESSGADICDTQSSTKSSKKENTGSNDSQVNLLQDLRRKLREEKDLQNRIRGGAASVLKYAAEDSDGNSVAYDGSDDDN